MNLHRDFKMVKEVLIEQWWMFDKIQNQGKKNIYTKKDHITVQSFNQCSFLKNYHMIGTGNDV